MYKHQLNNPEARTLVPFVSDTSAFFFLVSTTCRHNPFACTAHLRSTQIPTAAEFDREIKNLHYLFQEKETDANWESFDKALKNLITWTKLGAFEYESFLPAIRGLKMPINNSLITERTRLSGTATELIESLALVLGRNLEALSDLFLPTLIKLCGRTNKVMVTRGLKAIVAIITQSRVPRAIPKFCEPLIQVDPNKGLRAVMAECLLTSIKVNEVKDLEPYLGEIEKVIKGGAMDSAPEVREIVRKINEVYKLKFEERWASFVENLPTDVKKYLKVSTGASKPPPRRPLPPKRPISQQDDHPEDMSTSLSESDRANSNVPLARAMRVRAISVPAPPQPPQPDNAASRRPAPSSSEFSRALSTLEQNSHSRSNASTATTDNPSPNSSDTHSNEDPADSHSAASSVDDVAAEAVALMAKHRVNIQSVNTTTAQRVVRQQLPVGPLDLAPATPSVVSTPSSRMPPGRLLSTISSARKLEGGAILFGPHLSEAHPPSLNLFPAAPLLNGNASTDVNASTSAPTDHINDTASDMGSAGGVDATLPSINGRPVSHAMRVKAPIVIPGPVGAGLLGKPTRPIVKTQRAPAPAVSGTAVPSRSSTAGGAQRVMKRVPAVTEKPYDGDRPTSATTERPPPMGSTKARSTTAPLPALVEKKSRDVIAAVEKRRREAADRKEADVGHHIEEQKHKPKVIVEGSTNGRRPVSSMATSTRRPSQPLVDTTKRPATASAAHKPTATTSRKTTTTTSTTNAAAAAKPATSRSFVITKSRSTAGAPAKKPTSAIAAGPVSKKAGSSTASVTSSTASSTGKRSAPTSPVVAPELLASPIGDLEELGAVTVDETVVESISVASDDDRLVNPAGSVEGLPLLAMVAEAIAEAQTDANASINGYEYAHHAIAGPAVIAAIGGSD
ncbi:clasp N terminal-domain-containing protein [Jimgerdemannia flammicorona]|uniref:Clasp N terminal-domain-containing protein n=1 Tax=Jimgerdemannia flammicorona TaxID=994334 RepID=A0A433A2R9_9FUNG|nr:clasp N terminal-domain-containing protein [Jimgerdemannia flammicorona]